VVKRPPTRRLRRWCAAFLLGLLQACGGLSREEQLAIQAWLLCDDCVAGERQAVQNLGSRAVPALADALRFGPAPARVENVRRQLDAQWTRLRGLPVGRGPWIARHLANYLNLYRERAATSLGDIGQAGAADSLQAVLADHATGTALLPQPVLLAVEAALAADLPGFTGSLSDSTVGFLDSVRVTAAPGLVWDGDETVSLRGAPFGDSVQVGPAQPVPGGGHLTFRAVGRPGTYAVVVRNQGVGPAGVGTAHRSVLDIVSLRYTTHTPATGPNLAALPLGSHVWAFALGTAGPADSVDYVRFAPAAPLALTATLQWDTRADLDLRWRPCAAPGVVGNPDGATSAKPERTSVTVPAGACWLLGIHRVGVTSREPVTIGRLVLTSP
jgi:hypothetical protein